MDLVAGVASASGPADLPAMLGGTDAATRRFDEYVLTIKIADRLHNAQTWQHVPWAAARRKATETLNTLAPLANELGLPAVSAELRSLSIALLAGQEAVAQLVAPTPPLSFVASESKRRSSLTDAFYRRALRLVPVADRERYASSGSPT